MRTDGIRGLALAALFLGVPACGGAMANDPNEPVDYALSESPAELESRQVEHVERLDAVLASPEADCESACTLGDAICDLRDRVCDIADRRASDAETRGRCRDASERCDRSRERIAQACTCAL